MRARTQDAAWLIERRKPDARGFREVSTYVGSRRGKPPGWRIVRYLGAAMGTHDGSGLA